MHKMSFERSTFQLPQASTLLCQQQNPSLVVKVIPSVGLALFWSLYLDSLLARDVKRGRC